MRFSSLFSVFLAVLAVASPLAQPQTSDELSSRDTEVESFLVARADDKISAEYTKIAAAHKDVKNGNSYAFAVKCKLDL
jgi:hypothetical protein